MTRLFDLAADYREAASKLNDMDLPDEVIADTLDSLTGPMEVKATNIVAMIEDWNALAAAIKDAEVRMAARRKALENRASRVKKHLLDAMLFAGVTKIDSPLFAISVRDNPPSVDVFDGSQVPIEYLSAPLPPPPSIDKVAVKAAIKAGIEVPGARLVSTKRLDVK